MRECRDRTRLLVGENRIAQVQSYHQPTTTSKDGVVRSGRGKLKLLQ